MSVKLVNYLAGEYIFPETFRVEGLPSDSAVPSVSVENKDGDQVADEDVTIQPRTLTVTGTMYADTAAAMQAAYDALLQFVNGRQALKLYVDEAETRYINVRKVTCGHRFTFHSARTIAEVSLVFRAGDPFFYEPEVVSSQVVVKDGTFTVNNPGTAEAYPSSIIIRGTPDGTTTPKLTNQTAGRFLQYTGDLTPADILVCYQDLRGEKNGTGVVGALNDDFLLNGFPLLPGANTIKFEDAVVGVHSVTVELRFNPRYY